MKLGIKLPLILLTTAVLGLSAMGYLAYSGSRDLLQKAGRERLSEVVESRERELETWGETVLTDIETTARSAQSARVIREFGSAWASLGADASAYAIEKYITTNPNPAGERQKLSYAGDITNYSIVHRRYHPSFTSDAEQKGYRDIFLVDLEGNVVYSMAKKDDYGINLNDGPHSETGLGHVYAQAMASSDRGTFISDFAAYAPSDNAPSAFIAAPIRSESDTLLGVIVYQIPIEKLGAVMSREDGLGETGQGYIVSDSYLAVSDLRFASEPTILKMQIKTAAVEAALAGESGTTEENGALGMPSVAGYTPIDLFGLRKAAVVEQSTEEVFEGARNLAKLIGVQASVLIAALALISILVARSVANPLKLIEAAMLKIANSEYDTVVPYTDRADEVGQIARSLQNFNLALAAADEFAQDAALKGAAFASGSSALMMTDTNFNIIYSNPALERLFSSKIADFQSIYPDMDPELIVGLPIDIFHSDAERIRIILSESANLPFNANLLIGESQFALDISEVVMSERGRIGYVVEWRDVTEMQMNRAVLASINTNQITAEFSSLGAVVKVNSNLVVASNVSEPDLIGTQFSDLIQGEERSGGEIWDEISRNVPVTGRFTIKAGSEPLILQGSITPVLDRNQNMSKVLLIANDITQSQLAVEEAEKRRLMLQKAQDTVVDALRANLAKLSKGELDVRIHDTFDGPYEQLRADFNAATSNLASAMRSVIENAHSIENEASEISNAAEDLSHRTEQQAATLEETAAALDELTSSVLSSAQGASEADRVVSEARSSAQSSGLVVKQAVSAMGEIENSSAQISKIISVIDDIAFQTNLLALNAGVEAARAGEAGRGFAVVASEVRALAQRSSDAAREIDSLISASTTHVRRGVGLVGQAGEALEGILTSVADISARVAEIAASSQEQSAGLAQINTAVNQLDQVTQQNAAMFEQTTAASQALTREAQSLTVTTAQFHIGNVVKLTAKTQPQAPLPAPEAKKIVNAPRITASVTADDWEDF
jgi:methyl-accepting chemotaxis protein